MTWARIRSIEEAFGFREHGLGRGLRDVHNGGGVWLQVPGLGSILRSMGYA